MTGWVTKRLVAMLLPLGLLAGTATLALLTGTATLTLLAGTAALAQDKPADTDEAPREDAVRSPGPDAVTPETLANGDQPPVFGGRIFTGAFSAQPFSGFNPDYQIMIGDQLRVQLWGAVEFSELLSVDAQGNIFLPRIGPVRVAGIRNDRLTAVVEGRVRQVYRQQVGIYANLESAQPVSVLVSGFVRRPGMYRGLSSDSVLYFLDRAGGIDPNRGSFIDVRVQRGALLRHKVNLYDFLLKGILPPIQFADGDSVHVGPIANSVSVSGAVNNAARFEFTGDTITAKQVIGWASPRPEATHFRVRRNNAGETTAEFLPLIALDPVVLKPGDRVTIIPEDRPQTIVVAVSGEHEGVQEFAVPPNSRLGDIIDQLSLNERSDLASIQLFRKSVKERQRALLHQSLDRLEHEVWASRSRTDEEAALRLKEAELIQGFIQRARLLEPQGLVVLGDSVSTRELYLDDGDTIFIPAKSNLVTVAGEVMFPTAVAWRADAGVEDYITKAGGFTRTADTGDVLLRRANGEIDKVGVGGFGATAPRPGDEIMVLPEPNVKNLQLGKALAEILFQLAVTTSVILGL